MGGEIEPGTVTHTFSLKPLDYGRAQIASGLRRGSLAERLHYIIFFVAVHIGLIAIAVLWIVPQNRLSAVAGTALLAYAVFMLLLSLVPALRGALFVRLLRSAGVKVLGEDRVVTASPNGFTERCEHGATTAEWSTVRFTADSGAVSVSLPDAHSILIPRQTFPSAEQYEAFVAGLREASSSAAPTAPLRDGIPVLATLACPVLRSGPFRWAWLVFGPMAYALAGTFAFVVASDRRLGLAIAAVAVIWLSALKFKLLARAGRAAPGAGDSPQAGSLSRRAGHEVVLHTQVGTRSFYVDQSTMVRRPDMVEVTLPSLERLELRPLPGATLDQVASVLA